MDVLEQVRRFQRQPPVEVDDLIRSFGVNVTHSNPLHPEIAGQIERNGRGFLISTQPTDHLNRQRFTAAHELGHYLFHRDLLGEGVDDDRMYRSTNIGKFYNRNIHSRHETEANNFAAFVLMPEHLVRSWHNRLHGQLRPMAREFGVSPAAMRIRLNTLNLPCHE